MKKQILLGALALSTIALTACTPNKKGCHKHHMRNALSVEKVFEVNDLDKDGKLSENEFMKHKEKRAKRRNRRGRMKKHTPKEKFQMMDTDKNGFISQGEMTTHREMRKERRKNRRGKHHKRCGMNN